MNRRADITVFPDGNTPEPGVYVTVKDASGNVVSLFDDAAVPLGNPIVSDASGAFVYNVANDGTYIEEFRLSPTALPRRTQAVTLGIGDLIQLTPELYGAIGYPLAVDDGPALKLAADALSAVGSGVLSMFPGRIYVVGGQTLNGAAHANMGGGTMRYAPTVPYLLEIKNCTGPVIVNWNGAKIKCLSGKKYGSFNPDTTPYVGQSTDPTYAASPYLAAIYIHDNSGDIIIPAGGELDGNIAGQSIGGGYGDTGIQLPYTGVLIGSGNTGRVRVDIYSHHHGLDGATIDANGVLTAIDDIDLSGRFNNSGRQGVSIVGGNGVTLGKFGGFQAHGAGKDLGALTYSPPGAGVDLEPEGGKWVANIEIYDPDIYDNSGPGILKSALATNFKKLDVYGGRIVGTTSWSHWLDGESCTLHGTAVVGAFVNAFASNDPRKTFRHIGGLITDDVGLSPTGAVFNPSGVMVSGAIDRIYFEEVTWRKTKAGSSTNGGVGDLATNAGMWLHNCTIENMTADNFLVYGIYSGVRTEIINANTMPSPDAGPLFLFEAGPSLDPFFYTNTVGGFAISRSRRVASADRATGKKIWYGSATYDPPTLWPGATTPTQTMTVTGVALGDKVEDVSFSLDLAGARIQAWVSAANTVSYYFINENGASPLDLGSGTVRVKVRQT